jgi:hypothetical protein
MLVVSYLTLLIQENLQISREDFQILSQAWPLKLFFQRTREVIFCDPCKEKSRSESPESLEEKGREIP